MLFINKLCINISMKSVQKIKGFHNYTLLKIVQQINFWGMFIGFGVLVVTGAWYHFVLCALAILCISKIGHSIGQHRFFCHKSFKVTPWKEKFIALMATLSTTSSSIHYASVHRYHHAHSDKETDLHDPNRLGFIKSFFLFMPPESLSKIPPGMIRDLLKNKTVTFFHNWYWPIIISYVSILFFISPILVLYCYIIPAGYSKFISGVQLTFVHKYGYRNFETSDNSTNNLFWNCLTLGEGLHNNHHARPGEYRFDFTRKPGEFDFAGFLIKQLLIDERVSE